MIDPVKLAEMHKSMGECCGIPGNAYLDTATALRLLSAYAEAAGDEIRAWRAFFPSALAIADGGTRTDAARAALVAAGIRVGGGQQIMCPRCMPPGDPCCPYCNGTYEVKEQTP